MNSLQTKILGVTGPIGSGKSAAMALFSDRGIPTFDADTIAKELMSSRADIREKIIGCFGNVYHDNTLDRKKLASIVFHDDAAREVLNSIVHPPTLRFIDEEIAKLSVPLVAVETALLFNSNIETFFHYIAIVDAPQELCITRVLKRNPGLTREDILARRKAQTDFSKHYNDADVVIQNTGTLDELKSKIDFTLTLLSLHAIFPTKEIPS